MKPKKIYFDANNQGLKVLEIVGDISHNELGKKGQT